MPRTRRLILSSVLTLALGPLTLVGTGTAADDVSKIATAGVGVATKVSPAVVQIRVSGFGVPEQETCAALYTVQEGSGSGFFISSDGYILTNNHVVQGATRLSVTIPAPPDANAGRQSVLKAASREMPATLIGRDRETDLAVIKVEGAGYPVLEPGDSEALQQGEMVMAFGAPLGLVGTATRGIVSAAARQMRPGEPMVYIQTDAAISHGNSGGPLVNMKGQYVGVNSFIASETGANQGLGFAVPSHIASYIAGRLIKEGTIERGVIGVHAQNLTDQMRSAIDYKGPGQVILADVHPDTPAAKGGLEVGDIVLSLDGKPMENSRQFDVNLYGHKKGDVVTINVMHKDAQVERKVEVGTREGDESEMDGGPKDYEVERLGILALNLTERSRMRARFPTGAFVASTRCGVGSDGLYLERGDIIHFVNGQTVKSVDHLRELVAAVPAGEPMLVHIARDGDLMLILVAGR